MTPTEVTGILRQFNERCQDCQFDDPHRVMEAIDTAVEMIDRLEAAESALSNLGVTPDEARDGLARHKATLARLEAAEKAVAEAYRRGHATGQEEIEKEYQHALKVKEAYQHQLNETEEERDALRAKIEQMGLECGAMRTMIQVALDVLDDVRGNINPERGYADELEVDVERAIAAITLPGAEGE